MNGLPTARQSEHETAQAVPPELSIVVAAREPSPSLADGLGRWAHQVRGRSCELILAAPGPADWAKAAAAAAPPCTTVWGSPGSLTPQLWGRGIQRASGSLVALTIGRCVPASNWVSQALRAAREEPSAAGLGGPILPPPGGAARDWAAFFVRYSGYLELADGEAEEIPGDNAVYRSADLDSDWTERENGFWETLFHRRLRRRGRGLVFRPELPVRLLDSEPALRFAALRLRHGRHFGSSRELGSPLMRPLAALASPAIVPLLAARIRRRVLDLRPAWRSHLRRATPWLLLYLLAWAAGEASGYLVPCRTAD